MNNGDCSVQVVHLPHGLAQGCKVCRKVLVSGNYLVYLLVKDNDQDHSYFLGMPPFEHCGETKQMFKCFKTEEAALYEVDQVVKHLEESKSTEGLWLGKISPEDLVPYFKAQENN